MIVIVLSIVLGFALGLSIHALPRLREALDPLFATYYAVPIFIFYPVLIAIFGLSPIPIVLIGVATAVVAMIIATLNGLDRVPRVLTKVARVHRLGRLTTALQLQLPAAAPYLFTGVKLSVSYGFIAVIAAEFILSPAGLGRDIADAYADFNNRRMYALILFLLIIATIVNGALHALRHALGRAAQRRPVMTLTATRRATDTLIIVAVMLAVWQILHTSPATLRCPRRWRRWSYLMHMVPTARFAENAAATLRAFGLALLLAYGIGLASASGWARTGSPARSASPSWCDLFAAEDHALSGGAAHLRPRHFRQGRVRRHARHPAGGAAHHGRDPRHPARSICARRALCSCRPGRPSPPCSCRRHCRKCSPACASASP